MFLFNEGPTCFFLTKGLRVSFRRRAYVFLLDEGPTCFFFTKGLRVSFLRRAYVCLCVSF